MIAKLRRRWFPTRLERHAARIFGLIEEARQSMSGEEFLDYAAYLQTIPPDGCVWWANAAITQDGHFIPFGPGAKWAKDRRVSLEEVVKAAPRP